MTDLAMTKYEYVRVHLFMLLPNLKMSIKMLSPTLIRIRRFYHHWIWINKANMAHVFNYQNSIVFIFHIEYMQLVKVVSQDIR